MKNTNIIKYALTILLQIATIILTIILHIFFCYCFLSADYRLPAFAIGAIYIVLEATIFLANYVVYRKCKKLLKTVSLVLMIIGFGLNGQIMSFLFLLFFS
jgi:hypothetical protein